MRCDRIVVGAGEGFACWKEMPFLSSINLQNSFGVSDAGLAAVAKLSSLCSLNLKGCREISDVGLAALEPLSRLTFLRIQVRYAT